MADKKISALTAATTPLDGTEVLPIVQSGATVKVTNNDLRPKQIQSNATSGVLQVVGPAAATTRVMTVPNANFTVARTDAGQTFSGLQKISDRLEFPSTQTTYGANSISNTGTTIQIQGGTGGVNIRNNADTYNLWAIDDATGLVTINVGNLKFNTAAKGINFTANTPAAGMTSQLLNWYEEGAWDCSLYDNTGKVDNLAGQGQYVRVGNIVHVSARIFNGSAFTATGPVYMVLPFAAGANTANAASPVVYSVDAGNCLGVYIADGSANANLSTASSNMLGSNVTTGATFSNAKRLYFSLTYSAV